MFFIVITHLFIVFDIAIFLTKRTMEGLPEYIETSDDFPFL